MCVIWHIYTMSVRKRVSDPESPADVSRWIQSEAAKLWPAILGSLSLRRSPCIREHCPACLAGEQHSSYVLYGRVEGHRYSVYVPQELVPELRVYLANDRALKDRPHQASPRHCLAIKA